MKKKTSTRWIHFSSWMSDDNWTNKCWWRSLAFSWSQPQVQSRLQYGYDARWRGRPVGSNCCTWVWCRCQSWGLVWFSSCCRPKMWVDEVWVYQCISRFQNPAKSSYLNKSLSCCLFTRLTWHKVAVLMKYPNDVADPHHHVHSQGLRQLFGAWNAEAAGDPAEIRRDASTLRRKSRAWCYWSIGYDALSIIQCLLCVLQNLKRCFKTSCPFVMKQEF